MSLAISGDNVKQTFMGEAGGHRWQRIPPTEKRGRVQTSTVTVAVLDPNVVVGETFKLADVELVSSRGSGHGGQNRNKVESCITATHKPTGISVRIDMRSQYQSKNMALKILAAKLQQLEQDRAGHMENDVRKQQVGCGARGDKIRTYREQDNRVVDHRSGEKWQLNRWLKGDW